MFSDHNFLKAVINTISEGVVVHNAAGAIVAYNEAAPRIMKLSGDLLLGKTSVSPGWNAIRTNGEPFPGEEHPSSVTLKTGRPQKDVLMGIRPAGETTTWIKVNSQQVALGNAIFVVVSFTNVTDLFLLQEELRISEERWQFAIESNELGVWDSDIPHDKVFHSRRWKEMLGYEEHEIPSRIGEWENRIHPEDKEHVLNTLQRHLNGEIPPYKMEHRLRCKDGSYKWVLTVGKVTSRTPDGKPLRLVGTHQDIHAAKTAQERLRLSENTFANAFQFSAVGMALVSPAGTWMNVNQAMCRLVGYTTEELLQRTYQDITYPEDLSKDQKYVEKMLRKEITSCQFEKRYIHKDGHLVWVLLTASLVWKSADVPHFFVSQIIDISQTKYLISALESKNETLNLTALDLEAKIKQLEEFNRIVAHNLRGPATNIQMLTDLLPAAVPEINNSQYYDMLLRSSHSLLSTLDDLMTVVEVRLNRDIKFDTCTVPEMVTKLLADFKAEIIEKGALIEQDIQLEAIRYPKAYLESILYNLISNALKYTRPAIKPVIKISTYQENGQPVLKVQDNGLGIDLEKYGDQLFKLKKIFHKGFNSKGVGLFITKNQVETFGGNIRVQSKPFEGSLFTVTFQNTI